MPFRDAKQRLSDVVEVTVNGGMDSPIGGAMQWINLADECSSHPCREPFSREIGRVLQHSFVIQTLSHRCLFLMRHGLAANFL